MDSPFRDFIDDSTRNSIIIPSQLILNLLSRRIQEDAVGGKRGFLIDGFPRSLEQAGAFEEKVTDEAPLACHGFSSFRPYRFLHGMEQSFSTARKELC